MPIDPAGGGAISVTDGTTTVNPATTLALVGGTLRDLGEGEGEWAGTELIILNEAGDDHLASVDLTGTPGTGQTDAQIRLSTQADDGTPIANLSINSSGVVLQAYDLGTGNPTSRLSVVNGGTSSELGGFSISGVLEIARDPTTISFFGADPVAQPEIPASPNAQDIADVLVALGLATQAS